LVDIGSDTTTISVYSKNISRHLAVIPLGSNNITKDIASLQMEESDAEKLKLKYACAYTDNSDIDSSLMLTIDHDRQIESHKFIEIVESRLEEIIQNVRYQIPSDYYDKLLGGIILTGGGSNMKEIEKAFATHTNIEKIRIAKFVTQTIISSDASINAKNGTMNTILGLLAKGEQNCAGSAVDPNGEDLFGGTQQQTASTDRPARPTSERQTGVVLTEADKKAIEEAQRLREEAQKQKEEEEARIAEEEKKRIEEEKRKQEEEERRKRKENSMWNKFKKKVIDIVSESD
jgi:cell division protein FtsA